MSIQNLILFSYGPLNITNLATISSGNQATRWHFQHNRKILQSCDRAQILQFVIINYGSLESGQEFSSPTSCLIVLDSTGRKIKSELRRRRQS
jgi:hypothetical protein